MRASKLLHRILKLINYANVCKFIQNQRKMLLLYFLADFDSVCLSDRAWWGLKNFYTEFWNSLIMQIYANLFRKSTKNATSLSFLGRFWFCLFYLIGLGVGFKTSTKNFEIHYLCKFMQIYSKSMKNATSLSFLGRFWFCLFYLIGLGVGFKLLQRFWHSLIMQIYANLFKINEKCYFHLTADFDSVCFIW